MKICIILLLPLSACTYVQVKPLCLPLPSYSPEFQKATAEELKAHPELTHLTQQIIDYNKMQAQDNTCLKGK